MDKNYQTLTFVLIGILLGNTIMSIIKLILFGEFDFEQWLISLAGGISGALIVIIILMFSRKKKQ